MLDFNFSFRNLANLVLLSLFISTIKSATASVTPAPANTTSAPKVLPFSNILCDNVNHKDASFNTCNKYSDSKYACCYLSTPSSGSSSTSTNRRQDETFVYDRPFHNKLCVPYQARSDNYPKLTIIAGVAYEVLCPAVQAASVTNTTTYTYQRGIPCGARRAYQFDDCREFSLSDNSCCEAKLNLDQDFEIASCFFYGAVFNATVWNNVVSQEGLRSKENNPKLNYLTDDGLLDYGAMDKAKVDYSSVFNYTFQNQQIGHAIIFCTSKTTLISIFLIIVMIFFILI
jgi:hypothetical protein